MARKRTNGHDKPELDATGLPKTFATEMMSRIVGEATALLNLKEGEEQPQVLILVTRDIHMSFASDIPGQKLIQAMSVIAMGAEKEALKARLAQLEASES